jgi:hypothetical protein
MKTVKVPKSCRTTIGLIPEEQMEGIKVTKMQLAIFAKILGNKYIDQVIPLDKEEQIAEGCPLNHNGDEMAENMVYYTTPEGSHGWACSLCGRVIQWG